MGERLEQIRGRLDRIETAASAAEKLGQDKVRAIARQVAADVLAEGAPAVAGAWLPALMAALGWTGPPALAAMFAIKLAGTMLRRRVSRRRTSGTNVAFAAKERHFRERKRQYDVIDPPVLNDDYARQLAEVYALSGRSATADATLGREYDAGAKPGSSKAATPRWPPGQSGSARPSPTSSTASTPTRPCPRSR